MGADTRRMLEGSFVGTPAQRVLSGFAFGARCGPVDGDVHVQQLGVDLPTHTVLLQEKVQRTVMQWSVDYFALRRGG